MVASKFLHDDGEEDEVFNKEWANSGQVTVSRMNKLEKEFLAAIVSVIASSQKKSSDTIFVPRVSLRHSPFMTQDWMVFVQQQDFWERLQQLEKDVAYREVQKRGWCSYTELSCLMNTVQLIEIARTIINVSSICLATYAAGLATLLGSTLVAHFVVQSCLGTSFGSRQPANLRGNLTSTDLTEPLINAPQSQKIENAIPVSLICDESIVDCLAESVKTDIDNNDDVVSWQWWLNSMMIWLPEYSTSESDIEVTNFTDNWCVNGADFSSNSSTAAKIGKMEKIGKTEDFAPEDYRRNVNWKETASIWLMQDWRQSHQLHHESFFRLPAKFYY